MTKQPYPKAFQPTVNRFPFRPTSAESIDAINRYIEAERKRTGTAPKINAAINALLVIAGKCIKEQAK